MPFQCVYAHRTKKRTEETNKYVFLFTSLVFRKMRFSIILLFVLFNILLCSVCLTAKKLKDDDFSEFDEFDDDEFVVRMEKETFSIRNKIKTVSIYSRNSITSRC